MSDENGKLESKFPEIKPAATRTVRRTRRTKAMVEYTITQIYRLLVEGYNPEEIKAMLNIGDRNFCKYMQKIRDREAGDYKAKQQEYHLQYLQIARGRLMGNQRRLYEIINNPETSAKDIRASIKLDVELIFARLKLEYEGVTFSREF